MSLEVPGETSLSRHAWNNTNKMNQTFSDSINLLLETFQELTRRGNEAQLFLETRNGEQYGTLTVKNHHRKPAEPATTWRTRRRVKKSPSTVRRDQRRLKSFLERKSAQESPGSPTAASTPLTKPGLASSSQESLMSNETSVAILEEKEIDNEKLKNEGLDQQPRKDKEGGHETKLNETPIMSPSELADFDEKIKKGFLKALAPFSEALNRAQSCLENKDRNVEECDDDDNDNINNAKIWAQQQKQSCMK